MLREISKGNREVVVAGDELDVVRLRNDFYRDGINKIFIALSIVTATIVLLLAMSFYLHTQKPRPVTFHTDSDGRVYPPIPIDRPFIKEADLVQWLNNVVSKSFSFDFVNYKTQVENLRQYYTENGYTKLLGVLNSYANPNQVQNAKLFINANAGGVPTIFNQGLIGNTYNWILHVPLELTYSSGEKNTIANITLEITVIRVQINSELAGIAIDNVVVINKPPENLLNAS